MPTQKSLNTSDQKHPIPIRPSSVFRPALAGKPTNLEEAEAVVGFKIKVPKQKLGGKFEGYYTESRADGHQGIYLKYSSGYTFGAEKIGKVDYKADVAFERDVIFKESTIHPDSSFHVVYIAGHQGKACAPWHSGDEKGPPQLFWSDSGIEYDIVPYKLGFEEKQLIEVAESMYK